MFKIGNVAISSEPVVMGIINISPESFYGSSIALSQEKTIKMAEKHIKAGARILDIGARSTAPRSIYGKDNVITSEKELERVSTTIDFLKDSGILDEVALSVDTQRTNVAKKALDTGACIINDISGFKNDPKMVKVIADHDGSAIVMAAHEKPGDVWEIGRIIEELEKSVEIGYSAGISKKKIAIDPGIGSWHGRDYNHDYEILRNLSAFKTLKQPIMVGISRKSFIGEILDAPPEKRLYGSLAATCWSLERGANIIRTHDTKSVVDAIKIYKKLGTFDNQE